MASRLAQVASHLVGKAGKDRILEKHPDDVVVTCALRTAFTKGGKGGFKDTQAQDMLMGVFQGIIQKSGINPAAVEDIQVGNVLSPGAGATEYRAAAIGAGFPTTTAVSAVNRQCSSGLMGCVNIANAITAGMIDCGIGAGVESMSMQYGPQAVSELSETLDSIEEAANCRVPMGRLSEDMAQDLKISRHKQDEFAAKSYQKAEAAQKAGLFDEEIWPLTVKFVGKDDTEQTITVAKDDGVRPGTTVESLSKLRAAFPPEDGEGEGTIHGGNASQVSDGAAAVLLMRRSVAEKLGQKIIGKFVIASIVGTKPLLMGQGPWAAIPLALQKAGITKDDVDIWEINEAFASQCLWCAEQLGIDFNKINPKGGAIAFGHPLGCTGARQVSTLLTELRRTNQKIGVTSMCIGTGMGAAAVWVAE